MSAFRTTLRSAHGTFLSLPREGVPVLVSSPELSPRAIFTFEFLTPDMVALVAANGKYVCAENGGNSTLIADRDVANAWEHFDVIRRGRREIALRSDTGHFLTIDDLGTVSIDRETDDAWQWFTLGDPLPDGDVPDGIPAMDYREVATTLETVFDDVFDNPAETTLVPLAERGRFFGDYRMLREMGLTHAQALQGVRNSIYRENSVPVPVVGGLSGPLIRVADGWKDNNGYVLPRVAHFGDGLSLDIRNPALCDVHLDAIADANYHLVRTWTVLRGEYWKGRETGPDFQTGDSYLASVRQFAHKLHIRGLRWMVSQGDLLAAYTTQDARKRVLRDIITTINSVSPDLISFIDLGNETWQNGEPEREKLVELAIFIQPLVPNATITLTSPQGEEKAELDNYTFHVYDVHGSRAGRYWDKIRHIFSIPYEIKPRSRQGVQSEPFGYGERVSASSNKHELDDSVMGLAAAQAALARQVWVWFSGPGVMSDETEVMWEMPGFYITPEVLTKLPQDLMTFHDLEHGGSSQTNRVFAVPGLDETRADHAIHDDGRFVCVIYGPQWKKVKPVRDFTLIEELLMGDKGKIVIGKL